MLDVADLFMHWTCNFHMSCVAGATVVLTASDSETAAKPRMYSGALKKDRYSYVTIRLIHQSTISIPTGMFASE